MARTRPSCGEARKGSRPAVKITTEPLESSQVLLEIEVDPPRVERALDEAYRRYAQSLNVPGFRRGKAPRPLVERMVGRESLLEHAIEHLVPAVYREAVTETGLHPIEEATFQVVDMEPLRIKATVPVRPDVRLGDYRSLRQELVIPEITDAQVAEVIEQLRDSHATWVPVERAAQVGDRVAMDVHGTVGEGVLIDRQDVEYVINEDEARPLPGFAAKLAGLEPEGECSFTLPVPADFADSALAGQEAAFTVKLHWVKEKQLPELDDSFASTVGQFDTLEELRKHLREELQERAELRARGELEESVLEAVTGVAQLELPPQAIAKHAERLNNRLASSLDNQGISIEQYLRFTGKPADDFAEELRGQARRDLTRTFVLDAVAESEGITVEPVEVEAEIRRAAGSGPDSARAVRAALNRRETREQFELALRERKAIERLVALATDAQDQPATAAAGAAEERPNA